MKKLLLIIISIILILAVSFISYGYFSNETNIQKSETSEIRSSVATQSASSTSTTTIVSTSATEKATNIPEKWNDNGIFSDFYSKAYNKLSTMSLNEKIGQMILARCPKSDAVSSIKKYHLGGFVLFKEDFENKTAQEVISAIKSYQTASSIPMIMSVDEEGGKIVRISSNPKLADKAFQSPQEIYAKGGLDAIRSDTFNKAALLKKLGLNVNLAPVCDVSLNPSDYIYSRTLGKPAKETGEYVAAVVHAMQECGLSSTLKHFPGYGNNVDTHTGIAIDDRPYSTFVNSDFIPFEYGINAGVESILVSHNIVKCMDKNVPASLSLAVHKILRNDLHFTGVIITDDISMDAIKDYTHNTEPTVKAVLAGNDLILTKNFQEGYDFILNAVKSGVIFEEDIDHSVFRILAWKYSKKILK